ncbi:5'-methylthioadenosine phosphorylase [Ceratobasidium sp. AG-Ba]|nr:5'-methylthioadenosine phosphorylase [Ceratobasidium sp. AG-Ba]
MSGCVGHGEIFRKEVGSPEVNLFGIPDSELPPNVEHALHALAFHENRRMFRPNIFEPNGRTNLEQVWFPGTHEDVGGAGSSTPTLADISLLWVISKVAGFMKIRSQHIRYPDLSVLTPIDAYSEMAPEARVLDECETRLASGLLKSDSLIHESVAYIHNAPVNVLGPPKRKSRVLSIDDLRAIQWDIRINLVPLTTTESLKRSDTVTKRMLQAHILTPKSSRRQTTSPSISNVSSRATRRTPVSQHSKAPRMSAFESRPESVTSKTASPPPPVRSTSSDTAETAPVMDDLEDDNPSAVPVSSISAEYNSARRSSSQIIPTTPAVDSSQASSVFGGSDFSPKSKQSQTPPSRNSSDDQRRSTMSEPKVLIGIIGGSGLYNLENLTPVTTHNPETPWGYPSSPITISELPGGTRLAFLARHGTAHNILPSDVPARANIAALKSIGVKVIVAFSAVGSLREEIAPGDFIIPDQIIDRTKGIRPASFFEGTSIVAHAMFGDPFDTQLTNALVPMVEKALAALPASTSAPKLHTGKCVVCMEGPQFSTRAESHMYRAWGGDIINMSVLPEAKLAREAELSYALIATATDYDSWRVSETPVTVAEVFRTLTENADRSRKVTATILEELHELVESGSVLTNAEGGMKYSMITRDWPQADREKLAFVLPTYFGKSEN